MSKISLTIPIPIQVQIKKIVEKYRLFKYDFLSEKKQLKKKYILFETFIKIKKLKVTSFGFVFLGTATFGSITLPSSWNKSIKRNFKNNIAF